MTFLADMYSFLDPPGRTVLFSVDDRIPYTAKTYYLYQIKETYLTAFIAVESVFLFKSKKLHLILINSYI